MKKRLLSLLVISLLATHVAAASDVSDKAEDVAKIVVTKDLCVKEGLLTTRAGSAEQKFRAHLKQLEQSGQHNIAPDGYAVLDVSTELDALDWVDEAVAKQQIKLDQQICDDNERLWPLAKQYGAE
jgi:hypothetical protein